MMNAWPQTLSILEKTVNPGLYQVWIKPLDAEVADGRLTLFAPNAFVASWVRDRLLETIAEAAAQALGARPAIDVAVRPRAMQSAPCPDTAARPAASGGNGKGNGKAASAARRPPRQDQLGLPNLVPQSLSTLSWRFGFEDFVVGPCNELAYVAAKGMTRGGLDFDQMFLNSAPGLGKTHLLQSIGRTMAQASNRSNVRIAYLTAEEFATQLILSIRAREMERFKNRFRDNVDVLLLEDIHFLQGKERTQDELLETLKALQARGCKVVLSSSFLPRELKDVDDHLASRLCSGFLATIDRPCYDTRRRILESKARQHQVTLPGDVSDCLAEHLTDDVRQLESCLQSLVLKARLLGEAITMDMVAQVLRNYTCTDTGTISFQKILEHICRSFGVEPTALASKSRRRDIVQARNTAFYLARLHTDMPLKQIGSQLNRRHSTVLKGITNVEREIRLQTPLGRQIDSVAGRIKTL
jgi:chromosomal replication initiator protein